MMESQAVLPTVGTDYQLGTPSGQVGLEPDGASFAPLEQPRHRPNPIPANVSFA